MKLEFWSTQAVGALPPPEGARGELNIGRDDSTVTGSGGMDG